MRARASIADEGVGSYDAETEEHLDGPVVAVRIDLTREVVRDESVSIGSLSAFTTQGLFPSCERTVEPDRHAVERDCHAGEVRPQQARIPRNQYAAERDRCEEGEMHRENNIRKQDVHDRSYRRLRLRRLTSRRTRRTPQNGNGVRVLLVIQFFPRRWSVCSRGLSVAALPATVPRSGSTRVKRTTPCSFGS